MTAVPQAEEMAEPPVAGRRTPFGAPPPAPDHGRTTNIPDAVRRCRWIALDINAVGFSLLLAGPSSGEASLLPCFDSDYPGISAGTKMASGPDRVGLVRHAGASTLPCWWDDQAGSPSSASLAALGWAARIAPLVPGSSGLVFPVHAAYAKVGFVVFLGPDITLPPAGLFDIHARCFSLFDAVARMRPGESARLPTISKRELECLKLTANGYTSEEIARLLKLSVHTANQYLTNTVQKLDAVNRMHAVAKALRMGLIE